MLESRADKSGRDFNMKGECEKESSTPNGVAADGNASVLFRSKRCRQKILCIMNWSGRLNQWFHTHLLQTQAVCFQRCRPLSFARLRFVASAALSQRNRQNPYQTFVPIVGQQVDI